MTRISVSFMATCDENPVLLFMATRDENLCVVVHGDM